MTDQPSANPAPSASEHPDAVHRLVAELAAKNLPTDDEACVLHAMFPQEFAKLHAPKVEAPAPAIVVTTPAVAAPAAPAASAAVATGPGKRYRLTVAGQTTEALVEDLD